MHRNKPALYWIYLQDYYFGTGILNLLFWYLTWLRGPAALGAIITVKLLLTLLLYYIHARRKRQEIYYYFNNGISSRNLFLAGVMTDLLIWLIITVAIIQSCW